MTVHRIGDLRQVRLPDILFEPPRYCFEQLKMVDGLLKWVKL